MKSQVLFLCGVLGAGSSPAMALESFTLASNQPMRLAVQSIDERVKAIIVDQLGVDEGAVTPGANLVNDLGADSLDQVELMMSLEREFDISILSKEAEKLTTVKDIIDYIKGRKQLS